jgi:hypothetical protein
MANSRPSFTKRQKERSRQEKQAEKLQKKQQRKEQSGNDGDSPATQSVADLVVTHDEEGQPQGFDFHDFAK